jgi:K+-transporting ATPase c subunit
MKKRILSLSLAFLILTSFLPLSELPSAAADPVPIVVGHTGGVVTEADVGAAFTAAGLDRWGNTPVSVTFTPGVTSIGDEAFAWCFSLTGVIIPNSVTSIGEAAFLGTSLTGVVIPNSVTSIGNEAFADCSALTDITVDVNNPNYASIDGVLFNKALTTLIQYPIGRAGTTYTIPDGVTSIGDRAFAGLWMSYWTRLTSVIIPNSVISIGDWAFAFCALTGVVIPDSVTSIGEAAFLQCTSLTNVLIGNSVTSIGDEAFAGCESLTGVVIPDSVISLGDRVFAFCRALTGVVIGNSVTSIGNMAFLFTRLSGIIIPGSVTSIGNQAFEGCASLRSVFISNGVTSIGDRAFFGTPLTSVVIPESVTSIGEEAFRNCASLSLVLFESETPPSVGLRAFWGLSSSTPLAIVPYGAAEWPIHRFWNSLFTAYLCPICGKINDGDFHFPCPPPPAEPCVTCGESPCECPPNIVVGGSGRIAAQSNVNIALSEAGLTRDSSRPFTATFAPQSSLFPPPQAHTIGTGAFYNCVSLTSVVIPKPVYIFFGEIWVHGITRIDDRAFEGCTSLYDVYFESETPPSVGVNAFHNVKPGARAIVPHGATEYGPVGSLWHGLVVTYLCPVCGKAPCEPCVTCGKCPCEPCATCGKCPCEPCGICGECPCPVPIVVGHTGGLVTNVNVNTALSEAGLTRNGSRLFTVTFAPGVNSIGNNAFQSCTSLTEVVFPNSMDIIGNFAFQGCTSLTEVVFPNRVRIIGNNAFRNCTSLTEVVIPNSVTLIGDWAFQFCSSLTSVVIGSSVTYIGNQAFASCPELYEVYFQSETPPTTVGVNAFTGVKPGAMAIVPHGVTAYGAVGDLWNRLVVTWLCKVCGEAPCGCIINYGDIDGDGHIRSNDVTFLRRYIAAANRRKFIDENPSFNKANADVNGDGKIDAADVTRLREYIASGNNNAEVRLGPQV